MKVKNTMTRKVTYLDPSDSLADAYQLMIQLEFRHLPILKEMKVIGIISDRDVLRFAKDDHGELIVPDIPVENVMTREVVTCSPENNISYVALMMVDRKIDALPVIDTNGHLRGLVTSTDLLELLARSQDEFVYNILPFEFEVINFKDLKEAES